MKTYFPLFFTIPAGNSFKMTKKLKYSNSYMIPTKQMKRNNLCWAKHNSSKEKIKMVSVNKDNKKVSSTLRSRDKVETEIDEV